MRLKGRRAAAIEPKQDLLQRRGRREQAEAGNQQSQTNQQRNPSTAYRGEMQLKTEGTIAIRTIVAVPIRKARPALRALPKVRATMK